MNEADKKSEPGLRCHDADACAMGQKPCPTPQACGCGATACAVKDGTHKPAEAVHQISDPAPSIEAVMHDLRESHARTSQGEWSKGDTTHHTVSKRGAGKPYRVAEFRHADDAQFCDLSHAFVPRLIEEIEMQRIRIAELEALCAAAPQAVQPAQPALAATGIAANAPDLLPPMGIRNDRDMLNYLMCAFDSEAHFCERCGQGEDTKDMDSASFLREYLSAAPAHPAEGVPSHAVAGNDLIRAAKQALACMDGLQHHLGRAVCQIEADELRAALAATQPAAQGLDAQDSWIDLKIAFDIPGDEVESLWLAVETGSIKLPNGWALAETTGSGCAGYVAIFRVDHLPISGEAFTVSAVLAAQAKQGGA